MRDILISIKGPWADLILSGSKTVELRKSRPTPHTDGTTACPCRTAYICYGGRVHGRASILDIRACENIPASARDFYAERACVTPFLWQTYDPKYLWLLGNASRFFPPVLLAEIDGIRRAPQSWQYLTPEQVKRIDLL